MKYKNRIKPTKHHIIPRSRGGRLVDNIAYVSRDEHRAYHTLFGNRTPEECLVYLNERFWNNKYNIEDLVDRNS
jgi:hypothetical protein